jgi:hypothetical protein
MRHLTFVGFSFLLLTVWGCDGSKEEAQTPDASLPSIDISPSSAFVGSADLTLTITGKNFAGPVCHSCTYSGAVWLANGRQTFLETTFVSSTQLTAVVPAALLSSAGTAQVIVMTYVGVEDDSPSMTNGAVFTIATPSPGATTISSISPVSATAGSPDVTLTVTGSGFENAGFVASIVFWSASPGGTHCCDTWLSTTFVSDTRLTAVIPASLLLAPTRAYLAVVTGDVMGMTDGVSYPRSISIPFVVTP